MKEPEDTRVSQAKKTAPTALEGIVVIETASGWAGPTAGRLLADWGAELVKVEHPVRGDIQRSVRNSSVGMTGVRSAAIHQSDIAFEPENHNRNKRGITLDLSKEGGLEILRRLLGKADVLLSNFRPREVQKFGLQYENLSRLNPRLIHANLTGYGKKGPDRNAPGFDILAFWARSGFMHMLQNRGMPPIITPTAAGDRMAATALALGIMTALFMRERTGEGQEVDMSLLGYGVFALASEIGGCLITGQNLEQVDREHLLNAVGTFYETADGRWLRLGLAQADRYWSRFCAAVERKDLEHDSRFDSYEPRTLNSAVLFKILEEVFRQKTLAEWKVRLTEAGLPWSPVQNLPEVVADPQARMNGFFISYDHPTHGPMDLLASPVKLSKSPEQITRPAPQFGQHTEEVLLEQGYSWEDIERFHDAGVIA